MSEISIEEAIKIIKEELETEKVKHKESVEESNKIINHLKYRIKKYGETSKSDSNYEFHQAIKHELETITEYLTRK